VVRARERMHCDEKTFPVLQSILLRKISVRKRSIIRTEFVRQPTAITHKRQTVPAGTDFDEISAAAFRAETSIT